MSLERRAKQLERRSIKELSAVLRMVLALLNRVQKILPHPVWAMLVATLITFSGRSELVLRSCGLLLVVIWLAVELWAYLLPKRLRYQSVIGAGVTSVMLIGMMGIMWWWLNGELQDQQAEVYQNLQVLVRASETNKPRHAMFTLLNASKFDVGAHQLWCTGLMERYERNIVIQGPNSRSMQEADSLKAGGYGESSQCLSPLDIEDVRAVCMDVLVTVDYVLTTQPQTHQTKQFRFWGHWDGDKFVWDSEPTTANHLFCH